MGLMDKVKAQVDSLAQQANAGMAKLDNLPVQRKSDGLLRSLGVAVLAERTGRGNPGTSSEIDRLITEITQHESQNNIDLVQQAAQAAAQAQVRGQGPMGQGPMGQGSYMPSSPPASNQNVAGTMPGAGAGYGGYGAQTGPGPGGPTASGAPGGYPGTPGGFADGPGGFPGGPGGFPEPAPQQDQPEYPA